MKIQFPVSYWENNVLFGENKEVWAFYKLQSYVYDYLSDEEKGRSFRRLQAMFTSLNVDVHYLVLPRFKNIDDIHEKSKARLSGPLKDVAARHIDQSKDVIKDLIGEESADYEFYIGVKLPSEGVNLLRSFSFKNVVQYVLGYFSKDPVILENTLSSLYKGSHTYLNHMKNWYNVEPLTSDEMQWLIKRNFYRGMEEPAIYQGLEPSYELEQGERKPFKRDVMKLTEGLIDNTDPRKLNINQMDDDTHLSFMTVSHFPREIYSQGFEWVYAIQNLDFPVEMSIRTEFIDNYTAKKKLNFRKNLLRDQEDHASLNGEQISMEVLESSDLAEDLERSLNNEKHPILQTSILICVYAKDEDTLQERVQTVAAEYRGMNIELLQPAGDQLQLFNEFLPCGKRNLASDYLQYFEPTTLAAGMFGATKHIGDGEGFFIGTHGMLDRPVYINPAIATQNVAGSKTRSPSAIFIGPPGGGKSFNANLITYLSVLSGGKALVVDPKGERSNWDKDLPELKGRINIITLTSDEENRGRLDPYNICPSKKDAQELAMEIITFLLGIRTEDTRLSKVYQAVEHAECMNDVVDHLRESEDEEVRNIGNHLKAFAEVSLSQLLFGNGKPVKPISLDDALNVLQVQNLRIPPDSVKLENYNLLEKLSTAMMLAIGRFAHEFIKIDNRIFKVVFFDESWFLLKTRLGQDIVNRLIREGRYMKAGIYLATHNVNDIPESIESNIGIRYVFQNNNEKEVRKVLEFMG